MEGRRVRRRARPATPHHAHRRRHDRSRPAGAARHRSGRSVHHPHDVAFRSRSRHHRRPRPRVSHAGRSAYVADDVADELLGRPPGDIGITASSRLPGDLGSRPQSALDGDPSTAWLSTFGDPVGQWVEVKSLTTFGIDRMGLAVVADGRHSVPTRIRLVPDGAPPVTLDLPPIPDTNGSVTVPLAFPPIATKKLRVEIAAVREETTTNYFSKTPQTLPVGIVELGMPGLALPRTTAALDTGCRR